MISVNNRIFLNVICEEITYRMLLQCVIPSSYNKFKKLKVSILKQET